MKPDIDQIVDEIGSTFRTFGGGKVRSFNNPISHALKDNPLEFAAGVDVRNVVEFIARRIKETST